MTLMWKESSSLRWAEEGEWSVFVNELGVPTMFEHHRFGDEAGGGLWFDGKTLTDYDGVFSLDPGVISICEQLGYNMDYAKDEEVSGS